MVSVTFTTLRAERTHPQTANRVDSKRRFPPQRRPPERVLPHAPLAEFLKTAANPPSVGRSKPPQIRRFDLKSEPALSV